MIATYPMIIHVMRSIAVLFRCSCIASNCKQITGNGASITKLSPSIGDMTTHQTPRPGDTFVESLDALSDLKVRPASFV